MKEISGKKDMSEKDNDFTQIGRIAKAHGLKGDFSVELLTAHPEHLSRLESIYISVGETAPTLYTIERSSWNGSRLLFRVHGVADRNTAEALRGAELLISHEAAYLPGDDEYFITDLIGMEVVDTEGGQIGRITDVLSYPAHDIYVIRGGEKEILVPAVHEYIQNVDMDTGTVVITVVNGLID